MDLFWNFFGPFIKARITQLLVRSMAFVLAVFLGKDLAKSPDGAAAILSAANYLLGIGMLVATDLIIHSAAYGRLKTWWNGRKALPPIFPVIACVLIAISLAALNGCAQQETNRAAQGMIGIETFAANVQTLVEAGKVTEPQALALQRAVHDGQAATKDYYQAIENQDSAAMAAAKAAIAVAKQELITLYGQYGLSLPAAVDLPPLPPATTQPGK